MPDVKFSQLTQITDVNFLDLIPIIDVSDSVMSENGSNAIISIGDLTSSFFNNLGDGSISSTKIQTNPELFGNVKLPATTTIGSITGTEISFLSGLRNNIQYQLDNPFFPGTLTIGPGTTNNAPLKIVPSTNLLTTPVSGSVEFDGTDLYYTNSVPARQTLATTAYVDTAISIKAPINNPIFTGTATTILNQGGESALQVGAGTISNQIASVNLIGDTTHSPGLRLQRFGGANSDSEIRHRGTGTLNIAVQEAGTIRLLTNNAERARISSTGAVFIGNGITAATPIAASISATGGSGTDVAGANFTISGGEGTGTGLGGAIIFNTAPSGTTGAGVNNAVQRARILPAGQTIIGSATSAFTTRFGITTPPSPLVPNLQILSNTTGSATEANSSSALIGRFANNADGPRQFFAKTRGSIGTPTAVNSGDNIGLLSFGGYDGTQIVESARIDAVVDTGTVVSAGSFTDGKRYKILTVGSTATNWVALGAADANPGTVFTCNSVAQTGNGTAYLEPDVNSVPGAISMHTTPVSSVAVAPIERLRITSAGNVLIGTSTEIAGSKLYVDGTTSTASSSHVVSSAGIQSGVTTSFNSFSSSPTTAAANFTLPSLRHYNASQGTLGANSKITAQTGYRADSTLIGANANYGFYGDVPNTSVSTISNIGATTSTVTITTSSPHGFTPNQSVTIASSVTAVNGTFTLVTASGTTLTYALTGSAITPAAATGSITSAGRWNFYANGSAPNYFAGDVSIGTSSGGIISNTNGGNITFRTGTTTISDRLAVNADGSVRLATNPAFNAVGGTQVATTSFVAQSIASPVIGNPNQPGDARTLADADVGKYIRYTGANAVNYTVPSTLQVLTGSVITFRRATGAGVITLTAGSNVTINDNGASSVAAGKTFSIKCIDTGTTKVWDFIG